MCLRLVLSMFERRHTSFLVKKQGFPFIGVYCIKVVFRLDLFLISLHAVTLSLISMLCFNGGSHVGCICSKVVNVHGCAIACSRCQFEYLDSWASQSQEFRRRHVRLYSFIFGRFRTPSLLGSHSLTRAILGRLLFHKKKVFALFNFLTSLAYNIRLEGGFA